MGNTFQKSLRGAQSYTPEEEKFIKWAESTGLKPEDVGYNLSMVRGVAQNPTFDVAAMESLIANFEARPTDVFICTYVKCGTTWTQQIVSLLLNNGDMGEKKYGEVIPWLEALTSDVIGPREAPGHTLDSIKSAEGPRYFKTHAMVKDLPGGVSSDAKVIYITRNPKDVCVSLFHHASNKPEFGYKGDFETFAKLFLTGKVECGSFWQHNLEWYKACQDAQQSATEAEPSRLLFLQYEQLIASPDESIRRIAAFLGLPCDDDLLAKVKAGSSIDSMRSSSGANIGMNHLRQGGAGGWRKYFSVQMSEAFDQVGAISFVGDCEGFAPMYGPPTDLFSLKW